VIAIHGHRPGQDEFLGDGVGSEQSAYTGADRVLHI
jgi:hypothetical protein